MDRLYPPSPHADRSQLHVRLDLGPEEAGDRLVVSLVGELDVSTTEILEHALRRIEASDPRVLILDLRELRFLDSSGLLVILGALRRARRQGRRVVLVRGPRTVQRIFRRVGLEELLEFVDLPPEVEVGEALAVRSGLSR